MELLRRNGFCRDRDADRLLLRLSEGAGPASLPGSRCARKHSVACSTCCSPPGPRGAGARRSSGRSAAVASARPGAMVDEATGMLSRGLPARCRRPDLETRPEDPPCTLRIDRRRSPSCSRDPELSEPSGLWRLGIQVCDRRWALLDAETAGRGGPGSPASRSAAGSRGRRSPYAARRSAGGPAASLEDAGYALVASSGGDRADRPGDSPRASPRWRA